ncbi:Avirulence (Avh) protein [Phytophthora megakarya]|uniref:RxLR effector protein n=1 Tax=Phytophthora megakarya TaxID=4795 RepID=A0A225VLM7_9STRA|nr:Avirulence (Avh) protein [Phytophthora megakarya]
MRLSQVLVVATASFFFASEAIAVTEDSNQVKISTLTRGGPSQRLLRSYSKPVEEDSDDLDDPDDSEERSGTTEKLKALAKSWNLSYSGVATGPVKLSDEQYSKWKAIVDEGTKARQRARREVHNMEWRA